MIKPFRGLFALTQRFGENPDSYKKFGILAHNGTDYATPTGTQIIAPHGGKVVEATNDPTGYGNYLKIENDKEGSVLAHLQTFQVKVGDTVSEGQPIALSDNTGNSTGPHLHWGYYTQPRNRQNGYAGFIDQLPLLSVLTEPMATITQKALDEIIKARDFNWNNLQTANITISNQNKQIALLQSSTGTLQSKVDKSKTLAKQIVDL